MKKFIFLLVTLVGVLSAYSQDIIVTKKSQKIDAKILEVSKTEIKYKELDNLDGPTFILPVTDIHTIIYANGKVSIFSNSDESLSQSEDIIVSDEELQYYSAHPRGLYILQGECSMLFDKNVTAYLQIKYSDAEIVTFGRSDRDIEKEYHNIIEYCKKEGTDYSQFDIQEIITNACDKFNKYSLVKNKCKLLPFFEGCSALNTYIIEMDIQKIDMGSTGGSFFAVNNGTNTGGALICGVIRIIDPVSNKSVCEIGMDRIKGPGSMYAHLRLENAILEVFGSKIFLFR